MRSRWDEREAAAFEGDLGVRVYSSRLLGAERSLVLHGGGNTSVKTDEADAFGEPQPLLYVKGSGSDLATIDASGFTPVRLPPVARLASLPALSDARMVSELAIQITRPGAAAPSVETILHAILPYKFVDHTHADAVLTVTNSVGGEARAHEIYGDDVVYVPYVMPGFDLARECARRFAKDATARTIGMLLLNHGMFSFGDDARTSYERMIQLVSRAERALARARAWSLPRPRAGRAREPIGTRIAALRGALARAAGRPMIVTSSRTPSEIAFIRRDDLATIATQGPVTPDHVIRTKRLPMLGRDVEAYGRTYEQSFRKHARRLPGLTMLDPAPRVILDGTLGLCAAGASVRDAGIVLDIYRQTIDVILRATALGGYRALDERSLFAVEYWDLEQAKLRKGGAPPRFQGEIALVTGAASGIGRACVDALLARGAAVVGLDLDRKVVDVSSKAEFLGLPCDVRRPQSLSEALERTAERFGGLDMAVLNAGIFAASRTIAELDSPEWRRTMAVNLDANLDLLRLVHPYLKQAPRGGRVVVIGSKNVPAPGPAAAAYSASKAALTQLARVAALEWGGDGIRVNVIHPNAVFDTAIWTDEVLRTRAARYGMSVEDYKRNNVLRVSVESRDVAEMAAEMCGPLFAKTTGAQVPVDGGNERVI